MVLYALGINQIFEDPEELLDTKTLKLIDKSSSYTFLDKFKEYGEIELAVISWKAVIKIEINIIHASTCWKITKELIDYNN